MDVDGVLDRVLVMPDGCWRWLGAHDGKGYAHHAHEKVHRRVFRQLFEVFVAPIPGGHEMHHRCEQKWCVNPAHLEPTTRKRHHSELHPDHMAAARAARPPRRTPRRVPGPRLKTHCIHGHAYDEANTQWCGGRRVCGECARAKRARYEERRRLARLSGAN